MNFFALLLSSLFSVLGVSGKAAVSVMCAMAMLAVPDVHDAAPLIPFRLYQLPVFQDHTTKILVLHWSRQIGKSYTLAAWAVDRLLIYPGRLVTVLSNSRDNGAEFVMKAREVCEKLGQAIRVESNEAELNSRSDITESMKYELMRFEIRITINGKEGRIKVLAANPRTARGFSGDLILDEFAFHEDSRAIWGAAEPIISSNKDFLCRIASTGNGRRNMFYQMVTDGRYRVSRVRRSDAWAMGQIKIFSTMRADGAEITPDEARAEAIDKAEYDQNYECTFEAETGPLLPLELIMAAERIDGVAVDKQAWSVPTLQRMFRAFGDLECGWDFARVADLSVIAAFERIGMTRRLCGLLLMQDMRIEAQVEQASLLGQMPKFRRIEIDMTGNGLGAFERMEDLFGSFRVGGVNFSTTEPVSEVLVAQGRKSPTAKVTEIMATNLAAVFADKSIEIIADPDLRDDLHRPEKIVSPSGRVSIAASRDARGHADRFWAIALAVRAGDNSGGPAVLQAVRGARRERAENRRARL